MLLPLAHCPVVTLPTLTKGAAQSIIQISPGPTASQSDVLNMHLPNWCGFFAAETGWKKKDGNLETLMTFSSEFLVLFQTWLNVDLFPNGVDRLA